ncbi:MAG: hypothetical protein QXH40_03860 [Candidatus Bathyarchaeia archaeon]
MVEIKLKLTQGGNLYLPKEIRQAFTRELKLISNALAVLIFPANASYEDVLGSLRVIEADLQHRLNLTQKINKN